MIALSLLPERNCDKCTDEKKNMWGCGGPPDQPARLPFLISEEIQYRCPRWPVLEDPVLYGQLMGFYAGYKRGVMVEDGGQLSQPALLTEALTIIDATIDEAEAQRKAEDTRKKHRGGRGMRRPTRR